MDHAAAIAAEPHAPPGQSGAGAARSTSRLALDFNTDRAAAFRRARRHSIVVRVLRVALPVISVGLFASYGIFVQRSVKISKTKSVLTIGSASISTEALIAHNPKYEGFDKQGGKFVVHSLTAEQDFDQKGPVRLKTIDGRLTDASKNVTDLTAASGTLDTKTNQLELYEKINVVSQNGMTADLTRATIETKDGRITSDEPVVVHIPSGVVHGKALLIEQKAHQVLFYNGVIAHLKQDKAATPKPASTAVQPGSAAGANLAQHGAGPAMKGSIPPTAGTSSTGTPAPGNTVPSKAATPAAGQPTKSTEGLFAASDAPVDITSAKLLIDDAAKLATFSGHVMARQNDSTLETEQLEITYEGQATPGAAPAPAAVPGDPSASSKIKKLVSKTDVVLTRGTERATGHSAEFDATSDTATLIGDVVVTSGLDRKATSDRADMDNRHDTALLTGNVIVMQGRNVLKGRRLFVDRKADTTQMTWPAEGKSPKGRIAARMYQNEADPTKKKADAPADPAANPLFGGMKTDPNVPIDIEAEVLDVDDKVKTATFHGEVHAVQGDYTIRSEELVVVYSGEGGLGLGQSAAAAPVDPKAKPANGQAAGPAAKGTQLQKVTARRRVRINTKDGRYINGDTAEFDPKANIVTVVGNVTMSQNNHTAIGDSAKLNMTTGIMLMDQITPPTTGAQVSAAAPATGPGQPASVLPTQHRRLQMLLYPKDAPTAGAGKDAEKSNAKPATSTAAPQPVPQQQQQQQQQRVPAWSSQVESPFDRIR